MKVTPTKETAHQVTVEAIAAKESAAKTPPIDLVFLALREALAERDTEDDDATAGYNWAQQISNQISKAQSGHGPYRMRYLKIAELAIAAILSGDRNLEKQS